METKNVILGRASVRNFTDRPVPRPRLEQILQAGMSGPSCVNARDWAFLVVQDRDMLNRMADANGAPADPLRRAAAGILICGDLKRAFPPAQDYWVIDGAIAAQNMVLAAWDMGIGSVWLGTWPQMERVENQKRLFGLPETVIPHSVLALGWPEGEIPQKDKSIEPDRVHWENW